MKTAELKSNSKLEVNLRLQNEYEALVRKLLVSCGLVKEDNPYLSRYELLCRLEPTAAWEKQPGQDIPVAMERFGVVVFVAYGSKDRPAIVRCLAYQDDHLLAGVRGHWEGHGEHNRWGKLTLELPHVRAMTTNDLFNHDTVEKICTGVGDYREEYTLTMLRAQLMKERYDFLKQVAAQLGLEE